MNLLKASRQNAAQNMEVGDFSNTDMRCPAPAVMESCEVVSRRSWTYLAPPESQMCGVVRLQPMLTKVASDVRICLVLLNKQDSHDKQSAHFPICSFSPAESPYFGCTSEWPPKKQ